MALVVVSFTSYCGKTSYYRFGNRELETALSCDICTDVTARVFVKANLCINSTYTSTVMLLDGYV